MAANPFFSGRIPQTLLEAVENYRQQTGESKTSVLVKALSAYIGVSVEQQEQEPVDIEWRTKLEVRMETLERVVSEIQQELDSSATHRDRAGNWGGQAPPGQLSLEDIGGIQSNEKDDNSVDNKSDNIPTLSDNETDNSIDNEESMLSHEEVATRTSMTIGTIRNYHSKGKTIDRDGFRYRPSKRKGRAAWTTENLLKRGYQSLSN